MHSNRGITNLPPQKKKQLETLCQQLFKQKSLITSGKLQFIGLNKIKRRMGKEWEGLSRIVHKTAEEVIEEFLDKNDLYIRYKDDSYVIIFANANKQESSVKAAMIAEKIRQRLFEIDEKSLRDMEIRNAIMEIKTDALLDLNFDDMMDIILAEKEEEEEEEEEFSLDDISGVEVGTETHQSDSAESGVDIPPSMIPMEPVYIPVWDARYNALTTYLLLSREALGTDSPYAAYRKFCRNKEPAERRARDLKALLVAGEELAEMVRDKRKLIILCPVHYDTLHAFESYKKFKEQLEALPLEHRQFLALLVMRPVKKGQAVKDAYWFAKPLRGLCRHVFADIPIDKNVNFQYLLHTGVDVIGAAVSSSQPETEVISAMNRFSAKAKQFKVPNLFCLDVKSLSLTTSAACAGFDLMSGPAIHDHVDKPDTAHKYRHEDLLKALTEQK
ncbi:MAG: hypothetical protein OXT65_06205 [Alphaproteobacteria bacterium]|nr:hypothetical protein [Alphaproteobacteria bacterium]